MTVLISTEVAVEEAIGYVRVSAEMGRAGKDNFHSPVQQREAIEAFCGSRGIELVDVVEAIDQTSKKGQNFETEAFQELKAKIGPGTAIVVYRFDRFGRDLGAAMRNIEEIEAKGGRVLSATETNSNDSSGRLARDIFFSFAQYQLNRITEGWNAVQDSLHERGIHHGITPIGYEKPKVNGAPQPLVPNDDAWIVRFVFAERKKGTPWAVIARSLEEQTGREFSRQGLKGIIRNRVYLGEVRRGKRPVVTNAHPALIDLGTFEACQQPRRQTWAERDHLLTGIVFCENCGRRLFSVEKPNSNRVYVCQRDTLGPGPCKKRVAMTADLLEQYVEERFLAFQDDILCAAANLSADLLDLERALAEAEDDVRAWMQNTAAQRASMSLWEEELDRRARVADETRKALRDAHASTAAPIDPLTIKDAWPTLSNVEKRKVLTASIRGIYIASGKRGVKGLQTERVRIEWT